MVDNLVLLILNGDVVVNNNFQGKKMKTRHILFSIGKDRPGIVENVTAFLLERGANIEDSRMAAMGGQFTLTILYCCDDDKQNTLEQDVGQLEQNGLSCSFHEAEWPENTKTSGKLPLYIDVQAMDQSGIVHKVVNVLHDSLANVETLDTKVVNAPFSGEALFQLSLLALVPKDQSIAKLKKKLWQLAEANNFDLNFPKK